MTFYVFGNECDVALPSDSQTFETTATSAGAYGTLYDPVFCRAAVSQVGAGCGQIDAGSNLTTFWFHMMYGGNPDGAAAVFLDASLTQSFSLSHIDGVLQMYYLSAPATWTAIGSAVTVTDDVQQEIDIKVVPGASGSAELYVSGTRRTSGSASITQFASLRYAWVTPYHGRAYSSQYVVGDEPTVGLRVLTGPATGDGADTAGVGSYANINEAVFNDAAFNTFASANQVRTYDIGVDLTGYEVLAVGVAARAKCGASGPQNIQLALRSAGTNYFSTTKALNNGYSNVFAAWALDPATAAAWTAANAAAINYGTKSIT